MCSVSSCRRTQVTNVPCGHHGVGWQIRTGHLLSYNRSPDAAKYAPKVCILHSAILALKRVQPAAECPERELACTAKQASDAGCRPSPSTQMQVQHHCHMAGDKTPSMPQLFMIPSQQQPKGNTHRQNRNCQLQALMTWIPSEQQPKQTHTATIKVAG